MSVDETLLSDGTLYITVGTALSKVKRVWLSQEGTHYGDLYYADEKPEIIHCRECKHWFDIDDGRQRHRMCADIYGDWFCADAERRKE